jgi:hypothetical protein
MILGGLISSCTIFRVWRWDIAEVSWVRMGRWDEGGREVKEEDGSRYLSRLWPGSNRRIMLRSCIPVKADG